VIDRSFDWGLLLDVTSGLVASWTHSILSKILPKQNDPIYVVPVWLRATVNSASEAMCAAR